MTDDDRDMEKSDAGTAPAEPELGAIRGAFLAHQAQAEGLGTGSAGEAEPELVRGAYLSRLQRDGQRKRGDSVVGSEETGGSVLRGIYAARTANEMAVAAPRPARAPVRAKKAPPGRAKKAAAPSRAKKAAPAKKKAAARAKTAPKRKAAASRLKTARKAAPKRGARKAGRRR